MERDVGHEQLYNSSVADCSDVVFAHNWDIWA